MTDHPFPSSTRFNYWMIFSVIPAVDFRSLNLNFKHASNMLMNGIFSSIWIVSKIHALAIVIYEYFFPCVNIIA